LDFGLSVRHTLVCRAVFREACLSEINDKLKFVGH